MKSYFCTICKEEHTIVEESDMAKRAVQCDIHGHNYNASMPDKHSPTGFWCAFCARPITKEQYENLTKEA